MCDSSNLCQSSWPTQCVPFSFCSTASGVDTRRLGHSVVQTKKKPPRCHQLPQVIRVSTKTTRCSLATPEKKTTRLRRSPVDDRSLPGSRGTSLTDCRTAVLTASECTRGQDPDAEPNCLSSMFLLGMSWCSDCDDAFRSLRGRVRKIVIPTKAASQSGSSINRKFCSSTTAEQRQAAEKHSWTHRHHWAPKLH